MKPLLNGFVMRLFDTPTRCRNDSDFSLEICPNISENIAIVLLVKFKKL